MPPFVQQGDEHFRLPLEAGPILRWTSPGGVKYIAGSAILFTTLGVQKVE